MAKAVDYSFARYTAAQLKAAGVDVVFRYLRGTGKAVIAAELATLLDGGIEVVLCDEMQTTDATSGAAGGIVRGNAINIALHALGLPSTTPIYAAADREYEALTTPMAHFKAIASVRGAGACGSYGQGSLDEALRAAGYVTFTWQSESKSYPGNATTARTTNVQQTTTAPPLVTTDLDVIELPGDFGQLPRPIPQPAQEATDMKWGIQTTGTTDYAVIPGPTGLKAAGIANPTDLKSLVAMGAVSVTFAKTTFAQIPKTTLEGVV